MVNNGVLVERFADGAWRVEFPAREPWRHILPCVGGVASGLLLAVTSLSGIHAVFANEQGGLRLFALGWLGPLAVISMLLIWVGCSVGGRALRSYALECDGEVTTFTSKTLRRKRVLFRLPTPDVSIVDDETHALTFRVISESRPLIQVTHYALRPAERKELRTLVDVTSARPDG